MNAAKQSLIVGQVESFPRIQWASKELSRALQVRGIGESVGIPRALRIVNLLSGIRSLGSLPSGCLFGGAASHRSQQE